MYTVVNECSATAKNSEKRMQTKKTYSKWNFSIFIKQSFNIQNFFFNLLRFSTNPTAANTHKNCNHST